MTREGPSQEIRAAPGIVEVSLPESPTTGFIWRLAEAGPAVHEAGKEYSAEGGPGLAGGGGIRTFRLQIDAPGSYALEFRLGRPWLDEAIERRTVTIEVS